MKHKKIAVLICGTVILAILSFGIICCSLSGAKEVNIELDSKYNELFTEQELKAKGHRSIIPEDSNDVTTCYLNADGSKTLYVFASPIRFTNSAGKLSMIDTRLANVREGAIVGQGYIYTIANSDIKSFFPDNLSDKKGVKLTKDIEYEIGISASKSNSKVTAYKNFIGKEKNMVLYQNALNKGTNLYFYPSSLGTNCEIVYNKNPESNKISMWMKLPDSSVTVNKEPGGYLVLKKNRTDESGKKTKEIVGVIQKPLLKSKSGNISYNCSIEFSKVNETNYEIQFVLAENCLNQGSTAFISFEMRREKQPDNAIYSKLPTLKYAYLRNYSVIGNSDDYGIGRILVRYVFTKNLKLQSDQIEAANYYTYNLSNRNERFEMLSVLEDWCSLTGNWSKNYKTGSRTTLLAQSNQELEFNITEEVKKWCDDQNGLMEHNGILLKTVEEKEGQLNVLLSNDNSLFRNYTEVILK